MSEAIVVALISSSVSLVGIFVSNIMTAKKNETTMKVNQAVTNTQLENLTREVRSHNNFAQRMPVVEEQIRVMNNRIKDLERYHQAPIN